MKSVRTFVLFCLVLLFATATSYCDVIDPPTQSSRKAGMTVVLIAALVVISLVLLIRNKKGE